MLFRSPPASRLPGRVARISSPEPTQRWRGGQQAGKANLAAAAPFRSGGHRRARGWPRLSCPSLAIPSQGCTRINLLTCNFLPIMYVYTHIFIYLPILYVNFQMFQLVLEKAEEPEIKLPTSAGSSKKQESSRKTSPSALLTMPKTLTVWITINCGKF